MIPPVSFRFPRQIRELYHPPICEFKKEAAARLDPKKRVWDLSQAVPGYPPPEQVREAVSAALDKPGYGSYTEDEGMPELRAAIAEELAGLYRAAPPASGICVTAGANNAFFSTLCALAEAGDEIILLAPYFFNYFMAAEILGLRTKVLTLDAGNGFNIPLDKLSSLISEKTKAAVLVNPSNPTGRSYTQAEVDAVFQLCRDRGVVLICDEVYNYFHDDFPRPASVMNIDGYGGSAVAIHSYSKTFSMTGFRVGFASGSDAFLEQFLKVHDTNVICAPRISQEAALAGLRGPRDWLTDKAAMMRERVEAFRKALPKDGPFRVAAAGAFFVYLDFDLETDDRTLCLDIISKQNMVLLPGSLFGPGQENCLRLALGGVDAEDIPEVAAKLAARRG